MDISVRGGNFRLLQGQPGNLRVILGQLLKSVVGHPKIFGGTVCGHARTDCEQGKKKQRTDKGAHAILLSFSAILPQTKQRRQRAEKTRAREKQGFYIPRLHQGRLLIPIFVPNFRHLLSVRLNHLLHISVASHYHRYPVYRGISGGDAFRIIPAIDFIDIHTGAGKNNFPKRSRLSRRHTNPVPRCSFRHGSIFRGPPQLENTLRISWAAHCTVAHLDLRHPSALRTHENRIHHAQNQGEPKRRYFSRHTSSFLYAAPSPQEKYLPPNFVLSHRSKASTVRRFLPAVSQNKKPARFHGKPFL